MYGSGEIYGYESFDEVGLTPSVSAKHMQFLSVFVARDLEGMSSDGILGLAPSN